MPRLDEIRDGLGRFLSERLSGFRADLFAAFRSATSGRRPEVKEELLVRYLGFPFWDVLIFPIRYLSEVGEQDEIEVKRISPLDACKLHSLGDAKLQGVGLHHFGAFFQRSYREDDYLWGRLDAAENLIEMVVGDGGGSFYRRAFRSYRDGGRAGIDQDRPSDRLAQGPARRDVVGPSPSDVQVARV